MIGIDPSTISIGVIDCTPCHSPAAFYTDTEWSIYLHLDPTDINNCPDFFTSCEI